MRLRRFKDLAAAQLVRSWFMGAIDLFARNARLRLAVECLLLFGLFWVGCFARLDPDFGWHLRTGNYILQHGVPMHDIYTYTARSYAWVNHEWGNDVILALTYRLGGYALTSVLYAGLWTAAIVIVSPKRRILTALAAALAIFPYQGIRPLAWTTLLLALEFRIIMSKDRRRLTFLPFIFIFWANVHAGFIAGLAILVYYAIMKRNLTLFKVFVISCLVTLINPYNVRLYGEIAHTLFDPALHSQISEWASFAIGDDAMLFLALWIAGFLLFDYKRWQNWIGTSQLLLASALSATRNLPLFVIAALPELDANMHRAVAMIPKSLDYTRRVILLLMSSSILLILIAYLMITYLSLGGNRESSYPVQAVSYLQTHACEGNLFNYYTYGGYLIWKLPNQPVYIDGRMPTWRTYMDRYEAVVNHPAQNYQTEFKHYDIQCALLKDNQTKFIAQLKNHHWRSVVVADGAMLLLAPGK